MNYENYEIDMRDFKPNTIDTDEEYMAQGFTAEEVPMIRRHDILHNMANDKTIEEWEEMYELIEKLGL